MRIVVSAAFLFALAAVSEASTLNIRPPAGFIAGLGGVQTVTVIGEDVQAPGPELLVKLAGANVTSSLVVSSVVDAAVDVDANGWYEYHSQTYTIDCGSIAFADAPLIFEALAVSPAGPIQCNRSSTLVAPLFVGISDDAWVPSVDGDSIDFYVRLSNVELVAIGYEVFLDGVDISSQVSVTETVLALSTRSGVTLDRLARVTVDLTGITIADGQELTLKAILDYVRGGIQFVKSVLSQGIVRTDANSEAALEACVRSCLETFVSAASVSTSNGKTTVGATTAQLSAAADALRTCLKACGLKSAKSVTLASGLTVKVGIGSAEGGADLVVGVGDDGSGNDGGGNGTATNSQPGGAAVAVGGDGGSNGGTSGGAATANSNGGDAVAVGGAGGTNGSTSGPGGGAAAKNSTSNGKATAEGGKGGDPNDQTKLGGNGGSAKAETSGASATTTGGQGSTGKHGTGATAKNDGGNLNGSANGVSQDNYP